MLRGCWIVPPLGKKMYFTSSELSLVNSRFLFDGDCFMKRESSSNKIMFCVTIWVQTLCQFHEVKRKGP